MNRCYSCRRVLRVGESAHGRLGDPRISCSSCGPLPNDEPLLAVLGRRLIELAWRRCARELASGQ